MEVIAVTANSGYDANTGERSDEETEKELPGTVTLLVTPEQGMVLAELEAEGKLHLSLVYRGTKENARKFVEAQEIMLEELYPPEGEGTEESTEKESGTEETEAVEEVGEETVQGEETEATAGSESGVE